MLTGYTKSQQVVVGVLAAATILGLCVLGSSYLSRPSAIVVEPVSTLSPAPTMATPATATPEKIQVHVKGAVNKPGLVYCALDARVHDAIDLAGGLAPKADPDAVNLAARLEDGQEIVIPEKGRPGPAMTPDRAVTSNSAQPKASAGKAGTSKQPKIVSLNTASASQLDSLPGVGPSTAAAILAYRNSHGGFATIEELMAVKGIGPKKFEKMRPFLRL